MISQRVMSVGDWIARKCYIILNLWYCHFVSKHSILDELSSLVLEIQEYFIKSTLPCLRIYLQSPRNGSQYILPNTHRCAATSSCTGHVRALRICKEITRSVSVLSIVLTYPSLNKTTRVWKYYTYIYTLTACIARYTFICLHWSSHQLGRFDGWLIFTLWLANHEVAYWDVQFHVKYTSVAYTREYSLLTNTM